jgi:hypothetical protein
MDESQKISHRKISALGIMQLQNMHKLLQTTGLVDRRRGGAGDHGGIRRSDNAGDVAATVFRRALPGIQRM